jgi:hypothetical protein
VHPGIEDDRAPGKDEGVAIRPNLHMAREIQEAHALFCGFW